MISLSNRLLGRERDRAYNQRVIVTPAAVNLLSLCYFFPLGGGGGLICYFLLIGDFFYHVRAFFHHVEDLCSFFLHLRGAFLSLPPPPHLYEINAGSHAG